MAAVVPRLLQEVVAPPPTPGGPGVAFFLCILPLVFLVLVTVVKQVLLPTHVSLPAAAIMLALIRLAYLSASPTYVFACIISGLLESLTPLSIITGAILLFQTMDHTKCLPWMMSQISALSAGHPVAEVFLIGFAFAYLVEGASGFGTPVALAAPMLSALGHSPLPTVTCLLLMNTLATQFGAVGTPIWYGFGGLGLGDSNLQKTGLKAAIIVGICAYVVAPLAATFLVPLKVVMKNVVFVMLSISTAVLPSIGIAFFSYEFPSLIGGLVSVLLTAVLVHFKVGLAMPDAQLLQAQAQRAASRAISESLRPKSSRSTKSLLSVDGLQENDLDATHSTHLLDFPLTNAPSVYIANPKNADFECQVDDGELTGADHAETGLRHRRMAGPHHAGRGLGSAAPLAAADHPGSVSATGMAIELVEAPPLSASKSFTAAATGQADLDADVLGAPNSDAESGAARPAPAPPLTLKDCFFRTLPIWLTVLVLLVTRIPQLQLKGILQNANPFYYISLGNLGLFGTSPSVVIQMREILTESSVNWKYELFYIPFLLPFVAVSCVTIVLYFRDMEVKWYTPFREALERIAGITVATLGALVLVQLIRNGGTTSPAYIIGYYLSSWLQEGFLAISAFLGALGSFFSGSTTVSNLTFGDIQKIAAMQIGASVTGMLAVQVAGATMGNCVCINNILSAKAVMGLVHVGEGEFIRRTAPIGLLFGIMAQAIGLMFTLGNILPDAPIGPDSTEIQ